MASFRRSDPFCPVVQEVVDSVKGSCKKSSPKDLNEVARLLKANPDPTGIVFNQIILRIHKYTKDDQDGSTIMNGLRLVEFLVLSEDPDLSLIWQYVEARVRNMRFLKKFESLNGDVGKIIRAKANLLVDKIAQQQQDRSCTFPCPKCNVPTKSEQPASETLFLGDCQKCKFTFCTNCGKNYHGTSDCQPSSSPENMEVEYASEAVTQVEVDKGSSMKGDYETTSSSSRREFNDDRDLCSKLLTVKCPLCQRTLSITDEGWLAYCENCKSGICPHCKHTYHGPKQEYCHNQAAYESESKRSNQDHIETADSSASTVPEEGTCVDLGLEDKYLQSGVLTKGYENGFYKMDKTRENNDTFDRDDISTAFVEPESKVSIGTKVDWPWDIFPQDNVDVPAEYRSLIPGNWVEDEILETAMRKIVADNELELEVCVLESYLMRFGLKRSYQDGMLIETTREKDIANRRILLALLNTDSTGSGGHWILGIVDLTQSRIIILDTSLVISKMYYQKFFFSLLHIVQLSKYINGDATSKCMSRDLSKWELIVSLDCVQQNNAADCGPLVVANAYGLVAQQRQLHRTPETVQLRKWILQLLVQDKPSRKQTSDGRKPKQNTLARTPCKGNGDDLPSQSSSTMKDVTSFDFEPKGLRIQFQETNGIAVMPNRDSNSINSRFTEV